MKYNKGAIALMLGFLFMSFVSAFYIPENYPYTKPYTHEQGENRNPISTVAKIALTGVATNVSELLYMKNLNQKLIQLLME